MEELLYYVSYLSVGLITVKCISLLCRRNFNLLYIVTGLLVWPALVFGLILCTMFKFLELIADELWRDKDAS